MSSAPARGIVPHRPRRHHHHHHQHQHDKHKKHTDLENGEDRLAPAQPPYSDLSNGETAESRPKVNPIFLWAAQREQRIVEVRCEDYDKRNRIKLTKTAQGWRSIPRTALTTYATESATEEQNEESASSLESSPNEEKENSSTKFSAMKPIEKSEVDDARASCHRRLSEMRDTEEKVRRKRKKHGSCSKNKKRKPDLERDRDESLVTTSWKAKKRKKYDKEKKRKKMRFDKEFSCNDSSNDLHEVIIKEEPGNKSTLEMQNTFEATDSEDSLVAFATNAEFKNYIESFENGVALIDEDNKRSDFEVIQKSRHFQPRVVLEQLHFPLLSAKTASHEIKNRTFEDNVVEKIDIDKITCNDVSSDTKQAVKESTTDVHIEETIINNEDLEEILNKLDANYIPIDLDKSKFHLNETKELPRNCTKIGVSILDTDNVNNDAAKLSEKSAMPNLIPAASEKRNKCSPKDSNTSRTGSKSLVETIERLEKSISSKKKLNTLPDVSSGGASTLESKVSLEVESRLNEKSSLQNDTISDCSTSLFVQRDGEKLNFEQDNIENAKSLDFLKSKPEITVSLVSREKDELSGIDIVSVNTLPDSQTEIIDNKESHSDLLDLNLFNVLPIDAKTCVDSPESTISFSKREVLCDKRIKDVTSEEHHKVRPSSDEKPESDNESCNNNNDDYNKNFVLEEKDSEACENTAPEDNLVDSTKSATQKLISNQNKCSEAQAKLLVQPTYNVNDNSDSQTVHEFCCQVSPQPSGLSPMSPLGKSSSAYLERLLPSPPCSVSCSDDAKNDLTLASILCVSNDDLKNSEARETDEEFDFTNESELNSAFVVSVKDEKSLSSRDKKPFLQGQVQQFAASKPENPITDEELGEFASLASDCVFPKRPQSAEHDIDRKRLRNNNNTFSIKPYDLDDSEYIEKSKIKELKINPVVFLDPANQLRELLRTSGHLIPDPLLVPRDYLPLIAGAPLTEIPNLLATRPELRLPEALTRPELLTDPDLLVISLAHLQHVLDHGEASISKPHHKTHQPISSLAGDSKDDIVKEKKVDENHRPKLSCKPIGKLMPAPMDLSNNQKPNTKPPLLRVRTGLLKQESEVSSTANSPDDLHLWHPLFGSQKQRQPQQQQQQQQQHQQQQQRQQPQAAQAQERKPHQASWHRTTLTS